MVDRFGVATPPSPDAWPATRPLPSGLPEECAVVCSAVETKHEPELAVLLKYSSYSRLLRVFAYCSRFYRAIKQRINLKRSSEGHQHETIPSDSGQGLSVMSVMSELNSAETAIVRIIQRQAFRREIAKLQGGKEVPATSPLRSLNPLLDDRGLLRVGGRLGLAYLKYDQRHPIILPKSHHITKLIVRREHERMLHAGT